MRLGFLLGEVGNALRRNTSMFVSVVLVTMVSMLFLGIGLLTQRQVETTKGYWYERVQASIYLCTDESAATVPSCSEGAVTETQRQQILSEIEALDSVVLETYHETQDQAYERFREQFRNSPVVDSVPKEAIPESYRLKLTDPKDAAIIQDTFATMPGVETVQDPQRILGRFFSFLNGVGLASLVMAVTMLVCAVLLMSTTIRQTAWSRRREIGIMRLVGASNATINLPFIIETTLASLLGSALAVGLLWAMVHYWVAGYLTSSLSNGTGLISLIGESDVWTVAPWLIGISVLLSIVTSWLALRRHVRV